jgi:hypothetical protein
MASLSIVQEDQSVSALGTWQEFSLDFVNDAYAIYTTAGYTSASLSIVQEDQSVSITGTAPVLNTPCVLLGSTEVHGIVATVAPYVILSASVTYAHITADTCWDVLAEREAA